MPKRELMEVEGHRVTVRRLATKSKSVKKYGDADRKWTAYCSCGKLSRQLVATRTAALAARDAHFAMVTLPSTDIEVTT